MKIEMAGAGAHDGAYLNVPDNTVAVLVVSMIDDVLHGSLGVTRTGGYDPDQLSMLLCDIAAAMVSRGES